MLVVISGLVISISIVACLGKSFTPPYPYFKPFTGFSLLQTWKSAFRECAKLSSKTIDRQKQEETDERLKTWTTVGHTRKFGEYAVRGARAGMVFGLSRRTDLRLINDFDWLKEQFNEQQ